MDIEPRSSVSALMSDAIARADGKAMYLAIVVFCIGTFFVAGMNVISGDYSFHAWKVVIASFLMIPLTVLIYFGLASFSTSGSESSRWFNAACLVAFPAYFYFKLI